MGLAVPPHWAGRDAAELIASAPFIRYDRRSWGGRLVENYLAQNGFRPRDRFEIDALDGAFAMVAAGLGTAILPDWRSPHPQEAMVVIKALPGPPLSRVIGLYYRLGAARANLVRALDAINATTSASAVGAATP
jgi:DNA-binding transcriptional LysR family regulator